MAFIESSDMISYLLNDNMLSWHSDGHIFISQAMSNESDILHVNAGIFSAKACWFTNSTSRISIAIVCNATTYFWARPGSWLPKPYWFFRIFPQNETFGTIRVRVQITGVIAAVKSHRKAVVRLTAKSCATWWLLSRYCRWNRRHTTCSSQPTKNCSAHIEWMTNRRSD